MPEQCILIFNFVACSITSKFSNTTFRRKLSGILPSISKLTLAPQISNTWEITTFSILQSSYSFVLQITFLCPPFCRRSCLITFLILIIYLFSREIVRGVYNQNSFSLSYTTCCFNFLWLKTMLLTFFF